MGNLPHVLLKGEEHQKDEERELLLPVLHSTCTFWLQKAADAGSACGGAQGVL